MISIYRTGFFTFQVTFSRKTAVFRPVNLNTIIVIIALYYSSYSFLFGTAMVKKLL
jgi:hypothetical protein